MTFLSTSLVTTVSLQRDAFSDFFQPYIKFCKVGSVTEGKIN